MLKRKRINAFSLHLSIQGSFCISPGRSARSCLDRKPLTVGVSSCSWSPPQWLNSVGLRELKLAKPRCPSSMRRTQLSGGSREWGTERPPGSAPLGTPPQSGSACLRGGPGPSGRPLHNTITKVRNTPGQSCDCPVLPEIRVERISNPFQQVD